MTKQLFICNHCTYGFETKQYKHELLKRNFKKTKEIKTVTCPMCFLKIFKIMD